MKKIILIIAVLMLVTGCSNIKDLSYDEIIKNIATPISRTNTYRTGYKYYLPRGMQVTDSSLFNEVLDDGKNIYYLYVDAVSYINKVDYNYKINEKSEYSKSVKYDNKSGYVEINLYENNKYLVEIMYNYAKIEMIVDKEDINKVMLSAISILKSVEYNDSVIANLLEDNVLDFAEEELDIFNTAGRDNDYIQIDDGSYQPVEDEIPDTDLIN